MARSIRGQLRHDLIGPLSRILGYCELLAEDAEPLGLSFRVQSLRAVRSLGLEALAVIDKATIRWSDRDRMVNVDSLTICPVSSPPPTRSSKPAKRSRMPRARFPTATRSSKTSPGFATTPLS